MAIKSFSHKKLKQFYFNDDASGLNPNHLKALSFALDAIDSSHHPKDLKGIYSRKFSEKKDLVKEFIVLKSTEIGD